MRFIPTRVGYTEQHSILRHRNRFIPTRVGYTNGTVSKQRVCHGSSPLAWGIPLVKPPLGGHVRFIPTRVGYTDRIRKLDRSSTVHPHSRGVYMGYCMDILPYRGSSPLAWGIHFHFFHEVLLFRFIPTRVGYTFLLLFATLCRTRFIPTRVGYTKNRYRKRLNKCGSSPLAWGILLPRSFPCFGLSVHPHSRGVYLERRGQRVRGTAVHPHSRGVYGVMELEEIQDRRFIPTRVGYTDYDTVVLPVVFRFIPTRVGYTRPPMRSAHNSSVHPHSRGVYLSGSYPMALSPSVHPHSRGVYLSCKL